MNKFVRCNAEGNITFAASIDIYKGNTGNTLNTH